MMICSSGGTTASKTATEMNIFTWLVLTGLVSVTVLGSDQQRCVYSGGLHKANPLLILDYHIALVDRDVHLHENITLNCNFRNFCNITWYHDGTLLTDSLLPAKSYEMRDNNQSLAIDDVVMEHQGLYACVAHNETDSLTTEGYLDIIGQSNGLAIIDASLIAIVCEGEEIHLRCEATNYTSIRWYHDDVYIEKEGTRLYIADAKKEDEGVYKCVASNTAHTVERTMTVEVVQNCLDPRAIANGCVPSGNITSPVGSDVNITCTYGLSSSNMLFTVWVYKFNESFGDNFTNREAWIDLERDSSLSSQITLERNFTQKTSSRSSVYVTTVAIANVTESVYGHYIVLGFSADGGATKEQTTLLHIGPPVEKIGPVEVNFVFVGGLVLPVVFLIFVYWRYRLDIRIGIREAGERLIREDVSMDGRIYDVYIACPDSEISLVLGTLLPVLRQHGFTTCLRATDFLPGSDTITEIWNCIKTSRSCILVVTDEIISGKTHGGPLTLMELFAAIEVFSPNKNSIIPIFLKSLPAREMEKLPAVLKQILSCNKSRVAFTNRDIRSARHFKKSSGWKRIRLALPRPSEKLNKRQSSPRDHNNNGDGIMLIEDGIPTFDNSLSGKPCSELGLSFQQSGEGKGEPMVTLQCKAAPTQKSEDTEKEKTNDSVC